MKGVLLSGGTGTRLRPITHTGPKQLVPVTNKPVLQYGIEDLIDAGITEIGIVLGNTGREEIQVFLGEGSRFGVEVTYIIQGEPLGLAHAAGCAEDFVDGEDFVMYLGDNLLKQGIATLVEAFEAGEYGAGIALQHVDNPTEFGIVDVDERDNIVQLVEKPDTPQTDLALIGVYVFSSAVFDVIEDLDPSWRGELEITDAIQSLLDRGCQIDSHVVEGWWKDTGKPEDILEANRLVLEDNSDSRKGTIQNDAEVAGTLDLAENDIIESEAVVRGPVSIASGSTIKSGAYVGPYTSVGPDTIIENVQIENSVVVGDSEITTNGKIVSSLIGRSAAVRSADGLRPEGRRLTIGENSNLKL